MEKAAHEVAIKLKAERSKEYLYKVSTCYIQRLFLNDVLSPYWLRYRVVYGRRQGVLSSSQLKSSGKEKAQRGFLFVWRSTKDLDWKDGKGQWGLGWKRWKYRRTWWRSRTQADEEASYNRETKMDGSTSNPSSQSVPLFVLLVFNIVLPVSQSSAPRPEFDQRSLNQYSCLPVSSIPEPSSTLAIKYEVKTLPK